MLHTLKHKQELRELMLKNNPMKNSKIKEKWLKITKSEEWRENEIRVLTIKDFKKRLVENGFS